jgi:hypothetical protein
MHHQPVEVGGVVGIFSQLSCGLMAVFSGGTEPIRMVLFTIALSQFLSLQYINAHHSGGKHEMTIDVAQLYSKRDSQRFQAKFTSFQTLFNICTI